MCILHNITSSFHRHTCQLEFKMPLPPEKKQKTLACIREIQVNKLWTKVYSRKGLTAMWMIRLINKCTYESVCLSDTVSVVSVTVKRPVLRPCVVDGHSRNPLYYYYYWCKFKMSDQETHMITCSRTFINKEFSLSLSCKKSLVHSITHQQCAQLVTHGYHHRSSCDILHSLHSGSLCSKPPNNQAQVVLNGPRSGGQWVHLHGNINIEASEKVVNKDR